MHDRDRPTRTARSVDALKGFLQTESAGGVLLMAALAVALAWASSPWGASYEGLWSTTVLDSDPLRIHLDLRHLVNDAAMAVFFLVVSLEIRREIDRGELSEGRRAILPALGALGGMAVPAAIFLLLNDSGAEARGWAIPVATDIAFVAGALALLGERIPNSTRVFLIALAIVDDLLAIVVIALFYTDDLHMASLGAALAVLVVMAMLRWRGVARRWPYLLAATALWASFSSAGVHPTLAGVALALLLPDAAGREPDRSSLEGWEERIHPWTSFAIVPLFVLANAGLDLVEVVNLDNLTSSVAMGVALGLAVGKTAGITLFAGAAAAAARLPDEITGVRLVGAAALGGIGFTVSLFIAQLSFEGELLQQAMLGIMLGSAVAWLAGSLLLRRSG